MAHGDRCRGAEWGCGGGDTLDGGLVGSGRDVLNTEKECVQCPVEYEHVVDVVDGPEGDALLKRVELIGLFHLPNTPTTLTLFASLPVSALEERITACFFL